MVATACGTRARSPVGPSPEPAALTVSIMGPSRLTAGQLAAWFNGRQGAVTGGYRAPVPVETLAAYYVEEGAAEGVTGDVAFVQAIVETGWFRFAGLVRPEDNNFAGIGATGTGASPASFPDARTGVRAQNPAPAGLRRRLGVRLHGAPSPQSLCGSALRAGPSERQGAHLEPAGQRQLGGRLDLRVQHPEPVLRGPQCLSFASSLVSWATASCTCVVGKTSASWMIS